MEMIEMLECLKKNGKKQNILYRKTDGSFVNLFDPSKLDSRCSSDCTSGMPCGACACACGACGACACGRIMVRRSKCKVNEQ